MQANPNRALPTARPAADSLPLIRVVIARDGGVSSSLEFFQPIISFGRAPTADVRLDADNISRLHCTLELRADGLWIRDLGSLNGVNMDGERVQHALVLSKSVVTVGPFRFRARQEGELPPSRFPAPAPASDEWTRPGVSSDPAPQAAQILRPTRVDVPVVPAAAPVSAPSFTRTPVSAPAPWSTPASSPASSPAIARPSRVRPKPRAVRMGDTCVACHDGLALTWSDGLRCRACWGDGAARERIVRLGELCPCCHQGSMLKWENGLRCRNCGNTGHSTRQAQPSTGKFRAGTTCPSCAERPLLTWNGGLRCHGCGQGYR